MIMDFELSRAFTAQSKWADPKNIRGGKAELTADDVRAAVSIGLADHPFAFHALMWKWCEDPISFETLIFNLNDVAVLNWHERHPTRTIRGRDHRRLVEYAIEYWCNPETGQKLGDKGAAEHIGVHRDTFSSKYRDHFNRVTADLMELELVAIRDYRTVMRRE